MFQHVVITRLEILLPDVNLFGRGLSWGVRIDAQRSKRRIQELSIGYIDNLVTLIDFRVVSKQIHRVAFIVLI